MESLYTQALNDWNMLMNPTMFHKPKTRSEKESFRILLDAYRQNYKGAGIGADIADVAGTVADVSQFIPGANVVSNIARGVSVIAGTAERATKERELAAEQADAYRKNEALQRELASIRSKYDRLAPKEEMRQQRNLVLQSQIPASERRQRGNFQVLKAEAIRQLQAEGKTPAEVDRLYRARILQLQANPEARAAALENRGTVLAAAERTVSPQEEAEIAAAQAKYSHRPLEEINAEIQELNETPAPVSSIIGMDVGF
jgi:hypothetical protein